jgi:ornithine decarboxylase
VQQALLLDTTQAYCNMTTASGLLEDILTENDVFVGGSSIGKGFMRAARHYLRSSGQTELPALDVTLPHEAAFYVVDIGVVVSQFYQWRRYLPRVEPFYAVKCNPDPVLIQTLAILGCNFDCASKREIDIVKKLCADLPRKPEILYANPCKARHHVAHAVQQGVSLVTFDNVAEVLKCASISTKIRLLLRIVTDDRGAQCRLSSKFGAPKTRWRNLLKAAKQYGLDVVGVSFHVGSGCRDATKYEWALKDARELFDLAKSEFGFEFTILDIGGGFPGETHSFYNPEVLDMEDDDFAVDEGLDSTTCLESTNTTEDVPYMFFTEIAESVAPLIDEMFAENIRVIGEPGRYFVAAAATLVTSVVGVRSNELDDTPFAPEAISDTNRATYIDALSREEENKIVRHRGASFDHSGVMASGPDEKVWGTITEELNDYAKYYARQNFACQETDAYNDGLDLYKEDFDTAADLLGVPSKDQMKSIIHSVEGMSKTFAMGEDGKGEISLAAAGEAAVNGMVMQAVADSAPLQDDYAYYVNDGVYGGFNNLMFDHATVRPRVLRVENDDEHGKENAYLENGIDKLLYASTVFGPTCDSIDVIARSVLLPKLKIGDWLYFQNMGAYTMAAASSFNGFEPTEKVYVCSVQLEFFESLIAGPSEEEQHQGKDEEKKDAGT